ncbi:MAG TPA: alpha/beta hydrolase [Terriglobales bacterium]
METCFFGTDSHRLYGVVHGGAKSAPTTLVFCPPFAEEMVTTYARLARWSKQLEAEGISVVRFHPFGTGESGGTFREFTLQSAVSDACTALEFARQRLRSARLGYLGLRLGATLAVQAACIRPVDLLILWSPIISISQYLRELVRAQLAKEMVHQGATSVRRTTNDMLTELKSAGSMDLLGYEFSHQLYREMITEWNWPETPPAKHIIWLSRPAEAKSATPIVEGWKHSRSRIDFAVLPERAFWEEFGSAFADQFATTTLDWLQQTARTQ